MKEQLIELAPKLKQSLEQNAVLKVTLAQDGKEADAKKVIVEADKAETKVF